MEIHPEASNEDATLKATAAGWVSVFADLSADWAGVAAASHARITAWDDEFERLTQETAALTRQGKWVSGPADLMTIIGRHRDELSHSAAVAWLLTPTGHHGLGTRLLGALLVAGWPPPAYPEPGLESVVVDREVTCGVRRADIVVQAGAITLVIENKVDAPESAYQCEDLYRWWIERGPDIRFLLLSPLGRAPMSTSTRAAADAWRHVSYSGLAAAVQELIDEAADASTGSHAVRQYLRATSSLSLSRLPFTIHEGGGHVDGSTG